MKKQILKLIEKETNGICFCSQKYSIDTDRTSSIIYDTEREIVVEKDGETEKQNTTIDLTWRATQLQSKAPLFKYFLDGPRRVYKIDDICYDNKVYPVITGQIGVGCCKRENGQLKKQLFCKENIIVLPIDANADGNNDNCFFENIRNIINEKSNFIKQNEIKIDKILYFKPKIDADPKDLAVAKIQDRMIELEKELVADLAQEKLLNESSYLIKDGSLEYKEYKGCKDDKYAYARIRNNYRCVVGVSKSFNPSLARLKNKKSMAKIIADLPLFHRTPAMMHETFHTGQEKFSVWYLRIQKSDHCLSPFDGVVKVEKLLITDKEKEEGLDSEIINNISANIINERNPVCYGSDSRWANHLYPIYLTETFVKSQYLSNSFFLNMF